MKDLVNLDSMSLSELQERMRIFAARGSQLCGLTPDGKPIGAAVKQFFDELLQSTTDPEKIAQRNEFLAKAQQDPVAKAQLCAIRIETFSNYLLASINIIPMFFEVVNLGPADRPAVQNVTEQEVRISYIGQDGGVKLVKVDPSTEERLIPLRLLSTDKVRYKRVDLYSGNVVDAALKTLRLAYDMKNQVDGLAFDLLTDPTNGAFGVFTFTGKKANYTYLANSRINRLNLPSTNDITLSDNTTATNFRYKVLRVAQKYCDMWAGAFPEGDLMPTGTILIPGADAADIAEEIVPTDSASNSVAEQLLTQGYSKIKYLGKTWTLKPDNTLEPGTCFFELNRKPGRVYFKPSMDKEHVWGENDYQLSQQNEEERWNQKVFGAYINSALRVNALRIRYRTAS